MEKERLQEILEKHEKWLNDEDGGERANLEYADLTNADLTNADLSNANLSNANLSIADLRNANLKDGRIWDTKFTGVRGLNVISIQMNTSERNRLINYIPSIDRVSAGCFHGTLEELKDKVKEIHGNNPIIKERYEKAIEFIEFLVESYKEQED